MEFINHVSKMFKAENDMETNANEENSGTTSEDEDEVDRVPNQDICDVCLTIPKNATPSSHSMIYIYIYISGIKQGVTDPRGGG